jgi:predicted nucleic acid-binding protein
MTHLLDTSALLAHYFAENGGEQVHDIFADDSSRVSTSVLALYEFELRLSTRGVTEQARLDALNHYREMLDEVVAVDESVRNEAIRLRLAATAHISAMDVLIAATAALRGAVLVHRDPHFGSIPPTLLKQLCLPAK